MTVSSRLDDLDVASARLFLTVVEMGSVSKAATRHGVTQPSATARLQKLERQIGLQLLERGPTGSTVTSEGLEVAEWCANLVAAAAVLTDGARSLRDEGAARVRLVATSTVARQLLPRWIASEPLPEVDLVLTEATTVDIAHLVRRGEVDLGLLDGPGAPLALRSEILTWLELVVVVHRDHPWVDRKRRISGSQLTASRLILRRTGSGTRDVIDSALAEYELGVSGNVSEVSTNSAARLAAMNRAGVAILPSADVADDLAAGRLVEVRTKGVDFRQPVRAAWKGRQPALPAARELLATLRREAARA